MALSTRGCKFEPGTEGGKFPKTRDNETQHGGQFDKFCLQSM